MQRSGTSREAWERYETTIRRYIAQGQRTCALRVLMQHAQDAIVSYCRCHLLDEDWAQEVAQEIFLTAFAQMPGFRGHSSLKTWLYGIAWHKCVEVRRTRQRRTTLVRIHQETIRARAHCDPPSSLEDVTSRECCRRRVWDALQQLHGYERDLLVLRYLEDLTYEEIARILNVSRRTVERHLPRAEATFRHAYERCYTHARPARYAPLDTATDSGLIPLVPDVRPS
jgi:RNA polymerase sigma-70 factor (ECF subfamily)